MMVVPFVHKPFSQKQKRKKKRKISRIREKEEEKKKTGYHHHHISLSPLPLLGAVSSPFWGLFVLMGFVYLRYYYFFKLIFFHSPWILFLIYC